MLRPVCQPEFYVSVKHRRMITAMAAFSSELGPSVIDLFLIFVWYLYMGALSRLLYIDIQLFSIWSGYDGLQWPRIWTILRGTLHVPLLPDTSGSQPNFTDGLYVYADVLYLHEFTSESKLCNSIDPELNVLNILVEGQVI